MFKDYMKGEGWSAHSKKGDGRKEQSRKFKAAVLKNEDCYIS